MTQTFKHALIVCHPEEGSFTLSVARRYAEAVEAHGHEAVIRDLYRMDFDPVLRAEERHGEPARDVAAEWATLGKVDVFGFAETHRFHFDGVTDDIPERDVSQHLHEVDKAAREVMSRMVVRPPDRHPNPR